MEAFRYVFCCVEKVPAHYLFGEIIVGFVQARYSHSEIPNKMAYVWPGKVKIDFHLPWYDTVNCAYLQTQHQNWPVIGKKLPLDLCTSTELYHKNS